MNNENKNTSISQNSSLPKAEKRFPKVREFFRKKMVYLKRHPQIIPFLFVIIACIAFTFKLSPIGKTIAHVGSDATVAALEFFIITFTSFISVILFFGALKSINRNSIITMSISTALLILQLILDIILYSLFRSLYVGPNAKIEMREYVMPCINTFLTHIIIIGIYLISIITLPFYAKLFKKVNTRSKEEQALIDATKADSTEQIDIVEDV